MNGVVPETNGVLDKCRECGAFPGFKKGWSGNWSVECTECPNCTNTFKERYQAMTTWNMEQRSPKPTCRNDPSQ